MFGQVNSGHKDLLLKSYSTERRQELSINLERTWMFPATEGGEEYDDDKQQELHEIEQRKLSIQTFESGFCVLRSALFAHLPYKCGPFAAEESSSNGSVDRDDHEENDLRNKPTLAVPMQSGPQVSVLHVANAG